MLGKDVVHVRGYHIMPWSWHGAESAGLMLAAWFRELRRAGFSLSVSDSQDKKSGSRESNPFTTHVGSVLGRIETVR